MKPKLSIDIEKAVIKGVETGLYSYQINVICHVENGDIYFQNLKLISNEKCFGTMMNETNEINLQELIPFNTRNLLDYSDDEFVKNIDKLFDEKDGEVSKIRDFNIMQGSQKSFTLTGRFESLRYPDGYEEISSKDWKLAIDYKNRSEEVNFDFLIHKSSKFRHVY